MEAGKTCANKTVRKPRPSLALYVPPAQRDSINGLTNKNGVGTKKKAPPVEVPPPADEVFCPTFTCTSAIDPESDDDCGCKEIIVKKRDKFAIERVPALFPDCTAGMQRSSEYTKESVPCPDAVSFQPRPVHLLTKFDKHLGTSGHIQQMSAPSDEFSILDINGFPDAAKQCLDASTAVINLINSENAVIANNKPQSSTQTVIKTPKEPNKNGLILPSKALPLNDKDKFELEKLEEDAIIRAIENINRKSRPLIKYMGKDDILHIKSQKVENRNGIDNHNGISPSTWEDMFDANGELQEECFSKITECAVSDSTLANNTDDYIECQDNKSFRDLEHVIELYDFPSSFKTEDLMQLYRSVHQEPMHIKWCDDTHALLVLSSPVQAKRALNIQLDIIKSRPITQASNVALLKICKLDLRPAMKRPPKTMLTARRMITSALGQKPSITKAEEKKERDALREAREKKRLERQNEKDAWEGRPKTNK